MGVINVTPDSFSDGGVHLRVEAAVTAAWGMLDCGAAIVDVGGESTRPGSEGVTAAEELERIEQVLLDLAGAPVSVDTSKAAVARRALELGVELVNDVTALRGDPELAGVVADAGCYLCLMHMQGEPRTMQVDPTYDDVVSDVKRFLEERLAFAVAAGRARGAHLPRPGDRLRQDGRAQPRARAQARRAGGDRAARCSSGSRARARSASSRGSPDAKVGSAAASVGGAVSAFDRGASILRVHDVREHVEALAVAKAVAG